MLEPGSPRRGPNGPRIPTHPRKRALELALVVVTAPLWIPTLACCALAIGVFTGFPLFYRSQRRVHMDESLRITKFRTMVRGADVIANRGTVPVQGQRFLNIPGDSPLYTWVGRWIERLSLTEIPQFLHVLSGRMALIGSRPLPEDVIASLQEQHPEAEERFRSRCGMAGPIQLIGRDEIDDADRLDLECEYCRAAERGYSARLDLWILFMTVPIALRLVRPRSVEQVRAMMRRLSPLLTEDPAVEPSLELVPSRPAAEREVTPAERVEDAPSTAASGGRAARR